ncbi:MAG: hypothetical protein M9925_16800 [Chloroflexi bacterium]|nr:hypothetical protein [Dehalococcoidia bacterium]MCO5203343.1 hypothetical protein [Chloroflexota bacterium]MCZ7576900.1 hypothetical protein [Dehalococcoidia bacterium]NJD66108.1 hypothetical protein [Chloroflexota bacterium]PWB46950.1 MAG: hypothetical protein C3F10_02935 [Dehalococcoidia bacterium]
MNTYRPFLLLRARPKAESRDRFQAWFRQVHLRDVERIPGIVTIRSGSTRGGTQLGLYSFESADVVQGSLASPEAAYSRGTWEQWASELEELLIEMWAPVFPLPLYESAN